MVGLIWDSGIFRAYAHDLKGLRSLWVRRQRSKTDAEDGLMIVQAICHLFLTSKYDTKTIKANFVFTHFFETNVSFYMFVKLHITYQLKTDAPIQLECPDRFFKLHGVIYLAQHFPHISYLMATHIFMLWVRLRVCVGPTTLCRNTPPSCANLPMFTGYLR